MSLLTRRQLYLPAHCHQDGQGELNPNLSQLNPNLSWLHPNLSQLNPNLSQLNRNLSQLNPNLSQLNPNLSQQSTNMDASVAQVPLAEKLRELFPKFFLTRMHPPGDNNCQFPSHRRYRICYPDHWRYGTIDHLPYDHKLLEWWSQRLPYFVSPGVISTRNGHNLTRILTQRYGFLYYSVDASLAVTVKPPGDGSSVQSFLPEGNLLLIHIWNFHVLSHLLLIYICKLHWNLNTMFVCQVNYF